VALADTELLQGVRAAAGHLEEVLEGDGARVPGLALPVVCDLRPPPGLHVPVEAVLRDVQLAAEEPLRVRRLPLEDLAEGLTPLQRLRLLCPEPLEVAVGPLVDLGVADVGLRRELGRRRKE